MAKPDPSLGRFSLLPPEIRIEIWKHVSPDIHIARSLPRKPNHLSHNQDILFTSRKIYAEIAAEVPSGYQDDTIEISIKAKYQYKSWIEVKNTKGVQWDFEDPPDAISRGFCDLPWHELKVKILVYASSKEDSGQVICLYKKVRALTELLKGVKGFRCLEVAFHHTRDTSWFDGTSEPLCSIRNMFELSTLRFERTIGGTGYDYQYIFPLFLQLRNAENARMYVTASLHKEKIEETRENLHMADLLKKTQVVMRGKEPYGSHADLVRHRGRRVQEYLDCLFMLVERILDVLPSKTADMLRLDRFSSWYTDTLHGNSPYENELKRLLSLSKAKRNDPDGSDVKDASERYRQMRAHNPLSLAHRSAFPGALDPTKYPAMDPTDWNRDAWHCAYKEGIPSLDSMETGLRFHRWELEDDAPENAKVQEIKLMCYFELLTDSRPLEKMRYLVTLLED